MDKPLKDWTLEEVKEYCEANANCSDCRFFCDGHVCFMVKEVPSVWDLTDPPRFTDKDVEAAKAVLVLYPDVDSVKSDGIHVTAYINSIPECFLKTSAFPSLSHGETARLKDIIGE